MFYQLCSTGNYTQHHSCTRCRVSPPHSQFRLRWVLWQTNNFTVLGQTSSQTETAVGQQPDQFWSCYGGLYIFILCSLSVRLFFYCMSFLLFQPSPYSYFTVMSFSCEIFLLVFVPSSACFASHYSLLTLLTISIFFPVVKFLNFIISSSHPSQLFYYFFNL